MRIAEILNELDFNRKKVATPSSKIAHDPDVGNWTLALSKLPMKLPFVTGEEAKFIAKLTHKRKKDTVIYGVGDSQADAKADALAKLTPAQQDKSYRTVTADLNAPFTKAYLKGDASLWFKFDMQNGEPVMIMANRDYVNNFGAEIRELGFTKASKGRTTQRGDATTIWGFPITKAAMEKTQLIPNMRYTLEYTTDDKDGNSVFVMNPDSKTEGPHDKYRMGVPGVTIAATAINEDWDDDQDMYDDPEYSEYLSGLLDAIESGDPHEFSSFYDAVLDELSEETIIKEIVKMIKPEIEENKDHFLKLILGIIKKETPPRYAPGLLTAIKMCGANWPELTIIEKSLHDIGVIEEDKIKGADGKACWKGYRYAGTVKGKDKCIPVKKSKK